MLHCAVLRGSVQHPLCSAVLTRGPWSVLPTALCCAWLQSHLSELGRWEAAGYDPADVAQWLGALGVATDMHGLGANMVGGPHSK